MVTLKPIESHWKQVPVQDDGGASQEITLLVNGYAEKPGKEGAPLKFWELRRILPLMFSARRGVCDDIRNHSPRWRELASDVGVVWKEHFHASNQSAKSTGDASGVVAANHESSTALLMLMMAETASRRGAIPKKGKAALQAFFNATLTPEQCQAQIFEDIPAEIKTLHLGELHWPDHVAFLERLAFNYHGLLTPQAKLAELFFLMFLEMSKCVVFKSTLELMVSNVSQIIDDSARWQHTFTNDYTERGHELVMVGEGKRRRMDPGLQRFLGNAVAADRIANTTGAFLRSHPSMYNARHGLRWNEKAVCTEISAAWLTFHPSRHISVCADGIRSGGPATDDLVMLVEDVDTGYSNWLPPMDLSSFSLHV